MFAERYFTEKDAHAVQAFLLLLFPMICTVKYVGIYGELGTPGKLAYAVTFEGKERTQRISRMDELEEWLTDELDRQQAQQIIDLLET